MVPGYKLYYQSPRMLGLAVTTKAMLRLLVVYFLPKNRHPSTVNMAVSGDGHKKRFDRQRVG